MNIHKLFQTLLLAAALIPAYAETPAAQAPEVDLMTMNQDARCKQILVTCLINGAPMRMMLDTGATHTVLHEESAARVPNAQWMDTSKIQFRGNSAQQPKILLASLLAGPAESPIHPLMVMNLGAVRGMMAEPIDGILGMDILGQVPFTFNLRSGKLQWGIPQGLEPAPLYAVPDGTGRFIVQARCEGKEVHMLLDTGSSVTRVLAEQWAPGTGAEISAQIGDIDTNEGIRVVEGKAGDLELGPGVVAKGVTPILGTAEEKPILGMDALNGIILIHLPHESSPFGIFLLGK
jgi:predicted aspartyl protease